MKTTNGILYKVHFHFILILLVAGMSMPFVASANNSLTDSLLKILDGKPRDTERVDLLVDICQSLYYSKPDVVAKYAGEAYELATELEYVSGKSKAAVFLGWVNRITGNHPQAIEYLYEAKNIGEEMGDEVIQGKALFVLATVQIDEDNFRDGERLLYEAREKLKGTEAHVELGLIVNGIGEVRRNRQQYEEALTAYQDANKIFNKADFQRGVILTLNNMGLVHLEREEYEKCRETMLPALEMAVENDVLAVVVESSDGIAKSYLKQGELDKALEYATNAFKVSTESDYANYIAESANTLAEIYKAKGDYKTAMEYQEAKFSASTKINIEQSQNKIASLNFDYQLKEKENEIAVLNKDDQLRTIGFFALIAILGLAVIMIVLQKRASSQKQSVNMQLSLQNERLEELNREKDSLVGIVAHDLKAPLTKVQSLARMLGMIGGLSEQQADVVQKIEKVTQDGNRLIQDLLDITRAESSQKEIHRTEFDLRDLLKEHLAEHHGHAARKSIQIHYEAPENPVPMYTEESFVSRIFDNIVSNALKYSPENKNVYVQLKLEGKTASITVRDEGPGISEEDQVKMFRKFQKLTARPTAGESSTGLGLAIIKMLVESLGGVIEVQSSLGEGARFSVFIPTGK